MSNTGTGHGPEHPHGHSHSLSQISVDLPPLARRIVIATLTIAGLAVIVGAVLLWPSGGDHPIPAQFRGADGGAIHAVDGEIVAQTRAECLNQLVGAVQDTADIPISGAGSGPCIENTVRITSGEHEGKYTLLEIPTNRAQSGTGPDSSAQTLGAPDDPQPGQPTLHVGDSIRMSTSPGPDGAPRYAFFDFGRSTSTLVWAILFAAAVILVAAWRGLRSLIGLVFAFVVLAVFTLPAILDGKSPVAVAVVSSAAILFVVLYLAHGVSMRTSSALLGTLTSLLAAGLLSWLAIETMNLTGLSGDQTTSLQVYQGTISVGGLLLAGFIIGTLGVLNDVTITQASAAFELAAAGEPTRLATFRAAMRVGRDHIASTVYTLVFAYAGSALPLLLLFSVAQQPLGALLTSDTVAVELARSFVGGIAICLSVPLTTAIAASLARPSGARAETRHEQPQPQARPQPRTGRHSMPDSPSP
ncbi:YibE/F family protein [Gordonia sp. NPDC003376]